MPGLAKRGIWCGSSEAGRTQAEVAEYVDRMHQAGFNLLLVHLKGGDGLIYWPSERFADIVAPGYEEFDLPAALLVECRKRGMELHAWFIDYMEGAHVFGKHPEWASRNAKGQPTNSEWLRGRKFDAIWMCPARRPGYTDQQLVPIIEEFASKYDFDAVHHDYIRYPGDLAPDQYCFCDDCLENIPRWAGYLTEAFPDEPFYHELYDREYLEAHWEQSPRVLPRNWDRLDRGSKSRFLLDGSFFQGGRNDLDYFFYAYRVHWVREFARLAREAVDRARPSMKLSAAVFKNPIHSGRFIGQDWRTFAGYVDHLLPMDYRDHYPGDFETYLVLLKESIEQQKEWSRGFEALWPGFAINFLFFEEERPLRALAAAAESGDRAAGAAALGLVRGRLQGCAPELVSAIDRWLSGQGEAPAGVLESVPASYWPGEKVRRVVEAIASTGVTGMAMFCEGHLHQYGLWDVVREANAELGSVEC